MSSSRMCPGCHKPLAADAPTGLCPECHAKQLPNSASAGDMPPLHDDRASRTERTPPPTAEVGADGSKVGLPPRPVAGRWCDSRLPRPVQWLCLYAVLLGPLLWLVALLAYGIKHPAADFETILTELFVRTVIVLDFVPTIGLAIGGLMLARRKDPGLRWIRFGVWTRLAIFVLLAPAGWMAIGAGPLGSLLEWTAGERWLYGLVLLKVGIELSALVWLYVHPAPWPIRSSRPVKPIRGLSLWERQPPWLRGASKALLLAVFAVVFFNFVKLSKVEYVGDETRRRVVRVGAGQPWVVYQQVNEAARGEQVFWWMNLRSWSFACGLAALVSAGLLVMIERRERRVRDWVNRVTSAPAA